MKKRYDFDLDDVLKNVLPGGCAQPYVGGFVEDLMTVRYTLLTIRDFARSAAHFGRWLEINDVKIENVLERHLQDFRRHGCRCPNVGLRGRALSRPYIKRVRRFVDYLRSIEVVSAIPQVPVPELPAPLIGYRDWMLRTRGLVTLTAQRNENLVLQMLPALGIEPADYDAKLIRQVVLDKIRGLSPAYARTFTTALRSFLRFLEVEGRCSSHLERAVPTIPQWRLAALPRHLEAEDVERVIESCDLDQFHGVRDRAILLLLARLGLRSGDIRTMQLDDIDWKAGALKVKGKTRREVALPLPQDVGDALQRYMVHARPNTDAERVFLRSKAPFRPLAGSTVSGIVLRALRRAGITDAPSQGAHLLRHSAAVSMLRSGVSVDVISTILRHRSLDMTAYYAKVDVSLLGMVAQPWPEGAPC